MFFYFLTPVKFAKDPGSKGGEANNPNMNQVKLLSSIIALFNTALASLPFTTPQFSAHLPSGDALNREAGYRV